MSPLYVPRKRKSALSQSKGGLSCSGNIKPSISLISLFFSILTSMSLFDKFACGPAVRHTPDQNCELDPITHPKVGHL